jgi:hypothetical protein
MEGSRGRGSAISPAALADTPQASHIAFRMKAGSRRPITGRNLFHYSGPRTAAKRGLFNMSTSPTNSKTDTQTHYLLFSIRKTIITGCLLPNLCKKAKIRMYRTKAMTAGIRGFLLNYRLTDVQASPVYHFDDLITGRAISIDGKTIYTMDTYNKEDWHKIKLDIALKDTSQFFLHSDGYGWVLLNGHTKITLDCGKTWTDPA